MNSSSLSAKKWDIIAQSSLVVIPAFNEENCIKNTLETCLSVFPNIVVIDDGSLDSTLYICLKSGVQCIQLPVNIGQGGALSAGFKFFLHATNLDYLITYDGDGQHSAIDALKMLHFAHKNKLDFVFGSRFIDGSQSAIPLPKRITLLFARIFEKYCCGIKESTDSHNGLRILTRDACHSILPLSCYGMAHATEIRSKAIKSRLPIGEFPTNISYDNVKSQSPLNSLNIVFDLFLQK